MHKVHANLAEKSPLGIVARSLSVESNLSDNEMLQDPVVSLDVIREKRFALEAALTEHDSINTDFTAQRVMSIASELRNSLEALAEQVNEVAAGDIVMLGSSGFPLASIPPREGVLTPPVQLETRVSSVIGTVELSWTPVSGAYSYQIYATDEDPNQEHVWKRVAVTNKTKHIVSELESARFYWFRLTAIGANGESTMSRFARGIAA